MEENYITSPLTSILFTLMADQRSPPSSESSLSWTLPLGSLALISSRSKPALIKRRFLGLLEITNHSHTTKASPRNVYTEVQGYADERRDC